MSDKESQMPTLQIRFVSGKGWDSKIIEWYSRCEWSHVELVFLSGQTFGAQLCGGVRCREMNDSCYAKARAFETWEIPITETQASMVRMLCQNAENAAYDWPAILSFVLGPRLRIHLDGAYICSGFIAGILQSINLSMIDQPIENYDPADIRMLVPQIPGAIRR